MKISVDTDKVRETGQEIINLGLEYTEIIDTFFNKINGYPNADIWVGPAAQRYIEHVNTEKSTYDEIGLIIRNYGKTLIENAEEYETFIRESENRE